MYLLFRQKERRTYRAECCTEKTGTTSGLFSTHKQDERASGRTMKRVHTMNCGEVNKSPVTKACYTQLHSVTGYYSSLASNFSRVSCRLLPPASTAPPAIEHDYPPQPHTPDPCRGGLKMFNESVCGERCSSFGLLAVAPTAGARRYPDPPPGLRQRRANVSTHCPPVNGFLCKWLLLP